METVLLSLAGFAVVEVIWLLYQIEKGIRLARADLAKLHVELIEHHRRS